MNDRPLNDKIKPLSEWTEDDFQMRMHHARAKMDATGNALKASESEYRKLEWSEKSLFDKLFFEQRAAFPEDPNILLERRVRVSEGYEKFLAGLAAARENFLNDRHAATMAKAEFESLRSLGSTHRATRQAGG